MDELFARFAARAADQHHVLSVEQFDALGISRKVRGRWSKLGLIEQVGVHSFAVVGTRSWHQSMKAGLLDLGRESVIAGRAGAALLRLDGFRTGALDFLVPRGLRDRKVIGRLASTVRPILPSDVILVEGIRCLRAERLILEAPLFDFAKEEVENAIDSSVRLNLVAEGRLRVRVENELGPSVNGRRLVVDALVDAGGESKLERAFLRILRHAGLPRPQLQVSHRNGLRFIARVDTLFGEQLVIEVEGHQTHSSRRQRQSDEQRRTELTLLGRRVIVFTYDDVMGRPEWTTGQVREALSGKCA